MVQRFLTLFSAAAAALAAACGSPQAAPRPARAAYAMPRYDHILVLVGENKGFERLMQQVFAGNFVVLYQGSAATFLANMLSHYPW